ncbi:hypothetical protein JCM39068_39170 [Desulfocastanea catecholica]
MTKGKSSENLSPLELAQQEACKPGVCGTIWIQKLRKGEITEEEYRRRHEPQKDLQEPSEKE